MVIYSRNISTRFLKLVSNNHQRCVALHNYSQQMIPLFIFLNLWSHSVTQLSFVVVHAARQVYHS